MKLSISLPERDVELLDDYVRTRRVKSRSAAVQRAVDLLRAADLSDDYAAAWAEWEAGGDESAWNRTTHDGLTN
jgi:Arc/MetJ-type ribon-helix-helix transcriptional regulator